MKIGIDASNIRGGGGLTHLRELLEHADPKRHQFDQILVWGGRKTLEALPRNSEWLKKRYIPALDGGYLSRLFWKMGDVFRRSNSGFDLLFVPGGLYLGFARPFVTMCQNMLPFESSEYRRFGWLQGRVRLLMLRFGQGFSFRRANGVIYVTSYSQDFVSALLGKTNGKSAAIYHGVDPRFFCEPRAQLSITDFNDEVPFRLIYVSAINLYKHHGNVVEAISILRSRGYSIIVEFVGSSFPAAGRKLRMQLDEIDPDGKFVRCLDSIPYEELHSLYHSADAFINASSCEAFSISQLEAMASGLPVASSNRGPLPEVLGKAGVYFDPEDPKEIAEVLQSLLDDSEQRRIFAERAFQRAKDFTWSKCADATFLFLRDVYMLDLRSG